MLTIWSIIAMQFKMSVRRASIITFLLSPASFAQAQGYIISTFAGGAPPPTPILGVDMPLGTVQSVAADAMGNTYFVASHCVFKLDVYGVVTRIAGNGRAGYSGDGGPATRAQLQLQNIQFASWDVWVGVGALPPGIAVDNGGNVYVADNGNYRVRRISPDGIIASVAGNGTPGFSGDGGPAKVARLSPVFGLAVDTASNLLIADSAANRIRRVTPDGTIATVIGTGDCALYGDGGPATAAALCPAGIAADTAGSLFIADLTNNRIRQVTPDGTITTVVGMGSGAATNVWCNLSGDGGPAAMAELCLPSNVTVDRAGNLFVVDTYQNGDCWTCASYQVVRKISPSGLITTVAGANCLLEGTELCYQTIGYGTAATQTVFWGPLGLSVDNAGNLLVADSSGPQIGTAGGPGPSRLYRVSPGGAIAIMAGNGQNPSSGDGAPATSAQLAGPSGLAGDSSGNVFIADSNRIREVTPDGIIRTVAGNGNGSSSGDGGPAAMAQVAPIRIAVDSAGDLFFFDAPNRSIRKISRDGTIDTAIHVGGNDYFVTTDRANDLFIADPKNTFYAIAQISPDGTVRRVAGGANTGCGTYDGCSGFLGDGGPATSAQLMGPQGVAVDAAGNIFIADTDNHRIRKVTPGGIITTLAGNSPVGEYPGAVQGGFSGDGGPAIDAQLSFPMDVAADGAGNLYIADWGNNRIRKVSSDGIITTIAGDGTLGYSGDGGLGTKASLSGPSALAVDSAGNVYVADQGNGAIRVLRPAPHHIISRK
jgi:sugar lactone lactonase YvrE